MGSREQHLQENILIVDDDEDYCALLSRTIASMGYHTYWTTKTSEMCSLIAKVNPICVLLDLVFPHEDGRNLLKKVKKFRKDLPVVMLTGHDSIKTVVETMRGGASDYLTKPLDPEEFKRVMTRIGRKRRVAGQVKKIEESLGKVENLEDLAHLSRNIEEFIQIELKDLPEEGVELRSSGDSGEKSIQIPRHVSLREAAGLATQEIERRWILAALKQAQWKRSKAAEPVGMDTKTS